MMKKINKYNDIEYNNYKNKNNYLMQYKQHAIKANVQEQKVNGILKQYFFALPKLKFPHYDINLISNNSIEIVLAVAGFTEKSIHVSTENNVLSISGTTINNNAVSLFAGIAKRSFEIKFNLMPNIIPSNHCEIKYGLLKLELIYHDITTKSYHIPVKTL